jgi:hypothetical protein
MANPHFNETEQQIIAQLVMEKKISLSHVPTMPRIKDAARMYGMAASKACLRAMATSNPSARDAAIEKAAIFTKAGRELSEGNVQAYYATLKMIILCRRPDYIKPDQYGCGRPEYMEVVQHLPHWMRESLNELKFHLKR